MARFLIEVPHPSDPDACLRVIDTFLRTGSHFLKQAEWGCGDGDHTAWMIVDVDTKDEARNVIPPQYRSHARIVGLHTYTLGELEQSAREHAEQARKAQ